jgi:hypothetical protein
MVQANAALTGLSGIVSGAGGGGSTTVLQDNFVDANNTPLQSHTMNVGPGWTIDKGTFIINNNKAQCTGIGSGPTGGRAHSDAGKADVTLSAIFNGTVSGGGNEGLTLRYTDENNFWLLNLTSTALTLYERSGGTWTQRGTSSASFSDNSNYALQIVASGTNLTCTVNSGNTIAYNSATSNQTVTKHGISAGSVGDTFSTFLATNP